MSNQAIPAPNLNQMRPPENPLPGKEQVMKQAMVVVVSL